MDKTSKKKKASGAKITGLASHDKFTLARSGDNCTISTGPRRPPVKIGPGLEDTIFVFSDSKGRHLVMSVHYEKGYAVMEVVDKDRIYAECIADRDDIIMQFDCEAEGVDPEEMADWLLTACENA